MFPNLRAEIARRGLTFAQVANGVVDADGVPFNSVTHFSLKMNGKYPFTLDEAFAIKKFLNTKLSIDVLFQTSLEEAS